jgi:hypothetical protein
MKMKVHSSEECCVKCDALKTILTDIQHNAALGNNYDIRQLAESGLDLIRELHGEFDNVK